MRGRGIGSRLFAALMSRFHGEGIRQTNICRNSLFFPGLHPVDHEGALRFFIRRGIAHVIFTDEMEFRASYYTRPRALSRIERSLRTRNIRIGLVSPQKAAIFNHFLLEQACYVVPRFAFYLAGGGADAWEEAFIMAEHSGRVVGFMHHIHAMALGGHASHYRRMRWSRILRCDPSAFFIGSNLFVTEPYRRVGIGSLLFQAWLDLFLNRRAIIGLANTEKLAAHNARFGCRKIGRSVYLTRFP